MAASKEAYADGAWRWFDADGSMAVSKDVYQESSGGKWVRYDENGNMIKGLDTNEAGTYYFDPVLLFILLQENSSCKRKALRAQMCR